MRVALILLFFSTTALGQVTQLYRTVAPDGTVTFSDRPQGENSELIVVGTNAPQGAAEAEEAPEVDADVAEQMAANCERASESLATIENADSLFRILPSGERQQLSDEEVVVARADAQAEVARWCTPESE